MEKKRSSFTGRIGFVLAAAGSAVGLGNLWRFPYLAAKYGGGIFILVYLILTVTFGFALMITEIAIGRKTGLSCIGAYRALDKRFGFLGWLASLVPVLIVPYYCVIGGWVIKYFWEFLIGNGGAIAERSGDYFNEFIGVVNPGLSGNPMLWFVMFTLLTAVVVIFGVQKGIEKVSRIMMPILVVLSVVIALFVLTIPNAMAGIKYYLIPDFSNFSVTTVLGAVGQLFYSMSLAMGIMITYGSYMKKDSGLEKAVSQIELFDAGIALLAGFMIIPAVVAFNGGSAEGINAGPGLMFVTLPQVFNAMGFGRIIGTAFFLLVLFAALTSAISLMETVVSILMDKLGWKRLPSTIVVVVMILLLGTLSCLGYGPLASVQIIGMAFLDFFDFITNSVIMPIVAILTCILIGHIVGVKVVHEEVLLNGEFRRQKLYDVMIRWIAPILLVAILAGELLKNMGVISI